MMGSMSGHSAHHPLAGQKVLLASRRFVGRERPVIATIEDWFDRAVPPARQAANPAYLIYVARTSIDNLPLAGDLIYVKAFDLGYVVHASEIASVVPVQAEVASPN